MKSRAPHEIWYCKEYWNGDSRDGQYLNGEGYHYFQMKGSGEILKAYEFYETDDGDEKATPLEDMIGLNWFEYFGYKDDELLDIIADHDFFAIEGLHQN